LDYAFIVLDKWWHLVVSALTVELFLLGCRFDSCYKLFFAKFFISIHK
jgi:hypothetical protein